MRLLLAVALATPCPAGCSFLEGKGLRGGSDSPCGCGFGLVRRVKSRTELEKLSQPDLDAYKRDVDSELDELKGEKDAGIEKHKAELKEMKATSKEITDQMSQKAGEGKSDFAAKQAAYQADAEKVADLEKQVKELSDRQASAQANLAVVNGDLEFKLMSAQSCDCAGVEVVLAKHGRHVHHRKSNSEVRKEKKAKASLLSAPDFKTIFHIEKVESEIVDLLTDIQKGQSEYDKEVRDIQHGRKMADLNHTKVMSSATKDADLLKTRAAAQADAAAALEAMVASREKQAEAMEDRADKAKEQLDGLTAELQKCGCA